MISIAKNQVNVLAKLLTECFINDELIIEQIKGIQDVESYLEKLFSIQLPIFIETMDVFSLDESLTSILIGYEKNKYKSIKMIILNLISSLKSLQVIPKDDLKLYSKNVKDVSKCIDLKWQNEFVKSNYYYIKVVAISKSNRGKGIFRLLLQPIIDNCKEKNIPIILESNTASNIDIYEHFGFNLVKTIKKEGSNITQYCFIKHPE